MGGQHPAHGGGRDPDALAVAAAVRELAMRAINVLELLEDREYLGFLVGRDRVQRRTGTPIDQHAGGPELAPAPRAALAQLEVPAHAPVIPSARNGLVDKPQQLVLGGRRHSPRDPATQSQRPFPSASINRTPISFSASESRAISAFAAASSGSAPEPPRTPGLEVARASSAPWRATDLSFTIVERSTPDCSAAAAIVYSPRTRLSQISYFSLGERNRFPRRRRGSVPLPLDCGSLIFARSWKCPTGSQMRSDYRREVWR